MPLVSAGLLLFRRHAGTLEVLLVHPGGPFWKDKDEGAWSIPKGEVAAGDDLLATARREFHEETSFEADGPFVPLGSVRQKGGKVVHAWACEGDCDPAAAKSNTFKLECPPRSGRIREFPEIDRAAFWPLDEAGTKLNPAQVPSLDALVSSCGGT